MTDVTYAPEHVLPGKPEGEDGGQDNLDRGIPDGRGRSGHGGLRNADRGVDL